MKLFSHLQAARTFKNDPVGFVVDTLVKFVINLIIPYPLAGDIAMQFRGPVLGCLASLVILGVFLLVVIGTVILSPFLATQGFIEKIIAPFTSSTNVLPDSTFTQTSIPLQIPLGGNGLEYASITAGFMAPSYFLIFGTNHAGVDLVPNDKYFSSSEGYKQNKKVVVYATHTGSVDFYIDSHGSETVEVTNNDNSLKTIYMHMKQVFVTSGNTVTAGSPLGEMGNTGKSTGEHIHYEIRIKSGNVWLPVNPLNYIK